MSKVKYIGRTNDFSGKTLWEILGNLKNFGVGRLVQRNMFNRYPEPSYFKIVKVEALPVPTPEDDPDLKRRKYFHYDKSQRKVRTWVEKVFRGRKYPELIEMESVTYKPDFRLIPRSEESVLKARVEATRPRERILPATAPFPPLMKLLIIETMKEKGIEVKEEPQLRLDVVYKQKRDNIMRVAKEGEKPNVELGVKANPKLYEL
ncbi:mitochondrial ribosomal protein S34 [Lycorma delicatula]|uniref:mitochondrial ribosomal protein S34 n=1 Tax=Lycorma delicatula TaxID=130591 RepID=UPI003F51A2E5